MATSDAELDDVLDRIPVLHGVPRTVAELSGGLTNQNVHVTTPSDDYVVRRLLGDTDLLGIDRDAEHANTLAAAEACVGAPVVDYLPELGVLVIGYLEGRTCTNDDLARPEVLERTAVALKRLHAVPRFTGDFDMFTRQAGYLRALGARGCRLWKGYADHEEAFRRTRAALSVRAGPTVPCHNDLLAGNVVDDGGRAWLIDYEYSGNNDPCFDLGNTSTECDLDLDQTAALLTAYDGSLRRGRLARVRLQALVSAYGWALWGALQASASTLDFDFDGWGRERFEKAARGFTAGGFRDLLDEATRAD